MIKWDDNAEQAYTTAINPNVAQLFPPLAHTVCITQVRYNFSPRKLGLGPEPFLASSNYLLLNDPSSLCFPGRQVFAYAAIRLAILSEWSGWGSEWCWNTVALHLLGRPVWRSSSNKSIPSRPLIGWNTGSAGVHEGFERQDKLGPKLSEGILANWPLLSQL